MNDWPVGLSTGSFYQKSIFDCLELIRQNGFSMVEICSFPAHLDYHDLNAVHRAANRIEELGAEQVVRPINHCQNGNIAALFARHQRILGQSCLLFAGGSRPHHLICEMQATP